MTPGRTRRRFAGLAGVVIAMGVVSVPSAYADGQGSIDHVEPGDEGIAILYSIPDLPQGSIPDLDSLAVSVDGEAVEASAEVAADADAAHTVRRTTILAIDVSNSMRGERFAQAKLAAEAYLDGVSPDVYVGIAAYAGDVEILQQPSLDRAESARVLESLRLSRATRLYDGVLQAVEAAGDEGQRRVLVLSDGADTSQTELEAVTAAVEESGVGVDVVAVQQSGAAAAALEAIASAGEGAVLPADDPEALTALFAEQAAVLAQQVLITAKLPASFTASEGSLSVAIQADGEAYSDTAFVPLSAGESTIEPPIAAPRPVEAPGFQVSTNMMLGGLAAASIGLLVLLLSAFGVLGGSKTVTVEDRVTAYLRSGRQGVTSPRQGGSANPPSMATSAVGVAEKALERNAGLAASIGARLEAAGMSLKPAEWILMHAGIALGATFVGFLLSGGGAALMLLFLLCGLAGPWFFLGFKESRRLAAFNSQLADTLQLISGGLSAGLSLAQSVDTVVRQGSEPMKTEFKRALVEARLGVNLEDALESIAERMKSNDFKWVVIAVRIQREVGGNLSEVLGQVAATIRERDYLKRQVQSLSAEGKMSAWILGLLPILVFAFLMMTNPVYFQPMFRSVLGLIMLAAAAMLMVMAVFWLRKLIRMEV